MPTGREPAPPGENAFTARDVELAERRVAMARERAARAGLSAARSFEESAIQHERVAKSQDWVVRQGVPHRDVHREAAAEDRKLAELKRRESEADLAAGAATD